MELQMTLEADYAVRIVYELASSGGRIDASALAEASGVTVRFSLKILRKLVAAGLILSYKGAAGGYEIGKKAPGNFVVRYRGGDRRPDTYCPLCQRNLPMHKGERGDVYVPMRI